MQKINSVAGLKNAIQLLEAEKAERAQILKQQFYIVSENLKPGNIVKKFFSEFLSPKNMAGNFSGAAFGIAGGLLVKRMFSGKLTKKYKKLFGTLLQVSITNLIAQNSDYIKSVAQKIFRNLFRSKTIASGDSAG